MRSLNYFLPVAAFLLTGCADRIPANEARFGVHVGYMPTARRTDVRASEAIPNIDLSRLCRSTDGDFLRDQQCLKDEREAEAELQRRWYRFSAAERSACMPHSTAGIQPGYVELLTCFEMIAAKNASPAAIASQTQR